MGRERGGAGEAAGSAQWGGAHGGVTGARAGAAAGGAEAGARGGRVSGLLRGLVRERACRGGAEGEARSAVLYWGSLTVPRAEAAGTRGRGVPGDGAWQWDVRAPDTVSTPPIGSARALSSGASHPAPSPWVELGSTQGVVWCGVARQRVAWRGVAWHGVAWRGVARGGAGRGGVVWCGVVWCGVLKVLLPEGKGRDVLLMGIAKWAGVCVRVRALCYAPVWRLGAPQRLVGVVQGRPGDPLPLRLLV